MQGSAGQHVLNLFLSIAVVDFGSVPDWKETAFWRNDSYLQACRRGWKMPATQEAAADIARCIAYAPAQLSEAAGGHTQCLCLLCTWVACCEGY